MLRTLLLFLFVFASTAIAAEEIPMWEGVEKNAEMLAADQKFIESVENLNDRKTGATRALQLGWRFINEYNPEMAIKRFNQAWLLEPDNPNIHWGFALATHQQGKKLEVVNRHFDKAEDGYSKNTSALAEIMAERGRVFGERGMFKESIEAAKLALQIDSTNEYACRVIRVSAPQVNDQASLEICK